MYQDEEQGAIHIKGEFNTIPHVQSLTNKFEIQIMKMIILLWNHNRYTMEDQRSGLTMLKEEYWAMVNASYFLRGVYVYFIVIKE